MIMPRVPNVAAANLHWQDASRHAKVLVGREAATGSRRSNMFDLAVTQIGDIFYLFQCLKGISTEISLKGNFSGHSLL